MGGLSLIKLLCELSSRVLDCVYKYSRLALSQLKCFICSVLDFSNFPAQDYTP